MQFYWISFLVLSSFFMEKPAYRIFDQQGKASDYEKLLAEAQQADVVLFGELHNNPICHWLQLELTRDLYNFKKSDLVLGAEMYESDNQLILNEYLSDLITEKHLQSEAKIWDNYQTDYKPVLDFAKKNAIPFIATNIPRRYASVVSKKGLDALSVLPKEAKQYIAPLPIEFDVSLPAYANMVKMMGGAHGGSMGDMKPEYFAQAQAIKDATMAHFILENLKSGQTLVHFNGSYHSDNFESIVWYLKKQKPKLKIMTISSVEQESIENLAQENQNKADFILTIPQSMTKTY
ncbi:MAG: ChaN family lipoprotein [Microscillaceae bacterium]|nr:ChaN family lipoprotein [Microscillaceae bacterium]